MKLPLKQLREREGLTQAELSKALNISPSTVGMWEKGYRSPDYEMLGRIADYFDVTTDYLLGRDKAIVCLSKTESMFLRIFDMLNNEGQDLIMRILNSLEITHSKESNNASVVQRNSGGTNFLATGGHNSYRIVPS